MDPILGWILKIGALLIAATGAFIGVKKYKVKPDNFIEEHIEKKIKDEIGIDVDLSPDDADPDDKPSKE